MNTITVIGRLTKDPENFNNDKISLVRFSVAENKGKDKPAIFFDCAARDGSPAAKLVNGYFKKGSGILVSGEFNTREWTDKDNNKRTSFGISVDRVSFAGDKSEGSGNGTGNSNGASSGAEAAGRAATATKTAAKTSAIPADVDPDDVPF